jgi:DNA-binding GntR family transcriptional regulator
VFEKDPGAYRSRVALAVLLEREGARIARARMNFAIGAADVEAAKHLALPLDAPIVTARGVVTDSAGTAIYVGEFVYPAEVVQFDVDLAGPVRL